MYTEEINIEDLENESDVITNFQIDLPQDSKSAIRRAAKLANNAMFEDGELEEIIGDRKVSFSETKNKIDEVNPVKLSGNGGFTDGFDFSKLAEENPDWAGIPIILASENDLLAYSFFDKREQNEAIRDYRESHKQLED